MNSLPLALALSALALTAQAQRSNYSINEGWRFRFGDEQSWQSVTLPHTWNADNAFDDQPGYVRGMGHYVTHLPITAQQLQQQLFLRFEGAQTETVVRVNGEEAGHHIGGYTAFCYDVTRLLHEGDNLVEVSVDNSYNPDIPPLSADFTFYGGIYRDVQLLATPKVHVSATHYATSGVYVTTPQVDADEATVRIVTMLDNATAQRQQVVVEQRLLEPDGCVGASAVQKVRLDAGAEQQQLTMQLRVAQPRLWSISDPQLYRLQTRLLTSKGELIDQVVNTVGLRSFSFSTQEGFVLNGEPVKLVGTNRHQDYYGLGNALPDEMHIRDMRQIKAMGGNFLRISHYPQDPLVTAACDQLGIVTSVEIPVINGIAISDRFSNNCDAMMTEMIYQNFNSPSVMVWAFMNEILLRPGYNDDKSIDKELYLQKVLEYTQRVNQTAKTLDPGRYTMLPCHTAFSFYESTGLFQVADILGFNTYDGWYQGEFSDFERILDSWHAKYPDTPFFVSEYGADNDVRVHSFAPVRFDYSEEYANLFHRHYLPAILERPYINGATVWNYNDFGSESRGYAVPHTNLKGLVTTTRQPKDSYRYYQSILLSEPMLCIGGHDWPVRSDVADAEGRCVRPVQVYSNQPEVSLSLNGQLLGSHAVSNGVAEFEVPFCDGLNRLVATAGSLTDVLPIEMHLVPQDLRQFRELNVMLGSHLHFYDAATGLSWMPEQPYQPGSWGYVGGERFTESNWAGKLPTSSLNILGTDLDPLYQTQRRGLEQFRADVPDGEYVIYLHFCELDGGTKQALAYELGNSTTVQAASERRFDVEVNGQLVVPGLDVARSCGVQHPLVKRLPVSVIGGQGLNVSLSPLAGQTMLTAIRIIKL